MRLNERCRGPLYETGAMALDSRRVISDGGSRRLYDV